MAGQKLYIHYDKDHADNDAYVGDTTDAVVHNVWDANFKGVWHLAQDPNGDAANCIKDSTSNASEGTPGGSMVTADLVDAKVGKGLDFDATDYVRFDDDATSVFDITDNLTLELTVKQTTHNSDGQGLICKQDGGSNEGDYCIYGSGSTPGKVYFELNDAAKYLTIDNALEEGVWKYLAATYDRTNLIFYVDGVEVDRDTWSTAITTDFNKLNIGLYNTDYGFQGIFDEARISNATRSAAWIETTKYSNFDNLLTFGAEEASTLVGFDKQIPITIDPSKINETLSNFPILIHLSTASGTGDVDVSAIFDELTDDANRKKIAVTTDDGTTECYVEIERWDDANEEAWLWASIPSILYRFVDADIGIPVSVGGTIAAPVNIDADIEIPITVGTSVVSPDINASLTIPISVSGTLRKESNIDASLSIPISISGTMSEIDKRLTANLAIPISGGGTIEVYPMRTLVLVKSLPMLEITAEAYDSCIGVLVQNLPSLEIVANIYDSCTGALTQNLPSLEITAEAYDSIKGVSAQNVPSLEITAEAYDSGIGIFGQNLPYLGISASGYASVIANALVTLPCLSISAEGSSTIIGTLSRTLPGLGLSATGLLGSIGTLSVSLPNLKISATSYSSVIGTANITLPSLILSSSVIPFEYLSMVMNLRNQALTEFTNYEFNSMCHYKGLNLGATKTGINLLDTGDTDNDTAIDWNFRTGLLDLHMKTKKKLRQAWLSCKINGDLTVTVIEASGDEYEYDAESYEITEDGVRVKFGRGLKSRYLALDVKNDEEATIVLDSIRLNLDRTEKRR